MDFFKHSSYKSLVFYLMSNEEIDTILCGRAPSFLNLYEPVYLKNNISNISACISVC